jgi:hypothetical protein
VCEELLFLDGSIEDIIYFVCADIYILGVQIVKSTVQENSGSGKC